MKVTVYVAQINKAVGCIKEGHSLGITRGRLNSEWTGRTATIVSLALLDDEITSDDYNCICMCVSKCTEQLEAIIF